ncbi:MAG: DUF4331 domain-containing protein, partial [Actinobacteria bacterium]|nr:DUF4331 domain-containing protein [Actinomycetota bacterium]
AVIGMAPAVLQAADHLDAPGLMSPGGDARFDINDLYVFEGETSSNTVLALTVSPVATGDSTFSTFRNGAYFLRIDNDGDAVEDITYSVSFIDRWRGDGQFVLVRRATGAQAESDRPRGQLIGFGTTERTLNLRGGGMLFAGLRSDPFFFDLGGFRGSVEGDNNGRMLNDGNENDFFADLNTLAIVLEVADGDLGSNIGVWATTGDRVAGNNWDQVDRMGRPAINTVVNSSGPLVNADPNAKNVYNQSQPRNDAANFTSAVITALQIYSSLDPEGPYSDDEAAALAGVLLPDVVTYDTGTTAAGPLNGRALADDVIDIELRIVTGGDPLDLFPRDADGGINTDGVGAHTDYLSSFPYLGEPNS